MLSEFRVFHSQTPNHSDLVLPEGYLHFGTCLRSIVITRSFGVPVGLKDYQVFENEEAYGFLLSVICGLRSDLFGETEILGQFREFLKRQNFHQAGPLRGVCQALVMDAKKIRRQFMQNLGSHSYGSLIRRQLQSEDKVIDILGAGQLVEEILPWLKKGSFQIRVYTRNPEKHSQLKKQFPEIQLLKLTDFDDDPTAVVIVAAPVAASQWGEKISSKRPRKVFDLRGTSASDAFPFMNCYPLHQLFADIETNQLKIQQIKVRASSCVKTLANEKALQETPRPFGWDDLWAVV